MPRYRSLPAAAIILALCACAGAYFGHTALAAQDQVSEQYKVFTAGLSAIEDVYVGDAESDRVVYSAITGLLQTLDPHSSFMDPTRLRADARAAGRALLRARHHHPGDQRRRHRRLGLRGLAGVRERAPPRRRHRQDRERGHQRLDQRADGRPAQGTARHVREHLAQARRLRAAHRPARPARRGAHPDRDRGGHARRRRTGYIKLTEFAENTDRELGRALADLTKRGMKRLVFDLRGNPGGALDQAILVSSRFLPQGRPGRLHARARQRIGSGLSRAGAQRLPDGADDHAREPLERERIGDRVGRPAGSRSLARHRRDDVRQGAGAVGLSRSAAARRR